MSPLSSASDKPSGPFRKPRADVFTVLLLVALIALILGIVCLYAEMEHYEWRFKGGPTVSMAVPSEPTTYVECRYLPTSHCLLPTSRCPLAANSL